MDNSRTVLIRRGSPGVVVLFAREPYNTDHLRSGSVCMGAHVLFAPNRTTPMLTVRANIAWFVRCVQRQRSASETVEHSAFPLLRRDMYLHVPGVEPTIGKIRMVRSWSDPASRLEDHARIPLSHRVAHSTFNVH